MQLGELIMQHVGENDLDKEEQLSKSEKDFNQALESLDTRRTPEYRMPNGRRPRSSCGLSCRTIWAWRRSSARNTTRRLRILNWRSRRPQPAYQVRLAMAYQKTGKNDEALAICDKLLADPQLHPAIKQVAQGVQKMATQAKAAGGNSRQPCARSWARSN